MAFKRINSFQSKNLYQDYLHISEDLSIILKLCNNVMRDVSRDCINNDVHGNAGTFSKANKDHILSSEISQACNGIGDMATRRLGLTRNSAMLGYLFAKGSIISSNVEAFANAESALFRTKLYKPGTKVVFSDRSIHELSIDTASIMSELNGELNKNISISGRFSNSVIFRHADVDGRRISLINRSLTEDSRRMTERSFKHIANKFYNMYEKMHLIDSSVQESVVGFIKGKSYIDHAEAHLGCVSAASIDISKFYDSISLVNIIEKNLFYRSLCASFMHKTGLVFEPESFKHAYHYLILEKIFSTINIQFISAMNFLTHNGLLPTGAHYSPNISNLILGSLDFDILNMLSNTNIRYTRYADDMCVSSTEAKNSDGKFIINMDLVKDIEKIVRDNGFYLNYDKTKLLNTKL